MVSSSLRPAFAATPVVVVSLPSASASASAPAPGPIRVGPPARRVSQPTRQQVWRSQNADRSSTVALFDLGGSPTAVTANWGDFGCNGNAYVRDLWSTIELGSISGSYSRSLPAHGSALLRVTPGARTTPTGGAVTGVLSGRCVDVPNGSTVNGTQLVVSDCNGGTDQRWTLGPGVRG